MLSRKQIEDKVIEVVTETLALEKQAELNDSLIEDLGADSIDMVTLLVTLESEMSQSIDDYAMNGLTRLSDFVDLIESLISRENIPA